MSDVKIPASALDFGAHRSVFDWVESILRIHSQLIADTGGDEAMVEHCVKLARTMTDADPATVERFTRAMRQPFGPRAFVWDLSQKEFLDFANAQAMMTYTLKRWPSHE